MTGNEIPVKPRGRAIYNPVTKRWYKIRRLSPQKHHIPSLWEINSDFKKQVIKGSHNCKSFRIALQVALIERNDDSYSLNNYEELGLDDGRMTTDTMYLSFCPFCGKELEKPPRGTTVARRLPRTGRSRRYRTNPSIGSLR